MTGDKLSAPLVFCAKVSAVEVHLQYDPFTGAKYDNDSVALTPEWRYELVTGHTLTPHRQAQEQTQAQVQAQVQQAKTTAHRYRCIAMMPVGVRVKADESAACTGEGVQDGDLIEVAEVQHKPEENQPHGQTYLRLADGRGWVYTRRVLEPGRGDVLMELS